MNDYKIIESPVSTFISKDEILQAKRDLKETVKHPAEFDIYNPHLIVDADRSEISDLYALRVYNFFISQNHVVDSTTLKYAIPFEYFGNSVAQRNFTRDFERLSKKLSNISIYIKPEYFLTYFPEWKNQGVSARFSLFPTVFLDTNEKLLMFEVNPRIKEMFHRIRTTGFVKGDSYVLDGLSVPMNNLYWVLRKMQKLKKVHDLHIEEFKAKLHLEGKYKDWRNFKKCYLDAGEQAFESDWCAFTWEVIKRGGKGGAVKNIRIAFKRGPQDEKNSPVGHGVEWEKVLLSMGFNEATILKFRELISMNKKTFGKYCNKEFYWTNSYIFYSIDKAREEYKNKNKSKNKIENIGNWFYDSLVHGKYLDYVEKQPLHLTDL